MSKNVEDLPADICYPHIVKECEETPRLTGGLCFFRKEGDPIWEFWMDCFDPEISLRTGHQAAPTASS